MEGAGQGYAPPEVRDYGDLVALTKADATLFHVGLGGAGISAASSPVPPGGTSGGGTSGGSSGGVAPLGGELPGSAEGGSGSPTGGGGDGATLGGAAGGGDGGGGAGGDGGGGGNLPFTGFAVALVGAVGSGLGAAGVALRRRLSRGRSPD